MHGSIDRSLLCVYRGVSLCACGVSRPTCSCCDKQLKRMISFLARFAPFIVVYCILNDLRDTIAADERLKSDIMLVGRRKIS